MERWGRIDNQEWVKRMRERCEATMARVAEAVNAAPDGHWIDASEEACGDVLGEFRRGVHERAVRMRIEAAEKGAAFSPGGQSVRRSGG